MRRRFAARSEIIRGFHYALAEQLEVQEAVQDAKRKKMVGEAAAPSEDSTIAAAKQLLLTDAAQAVQRNAEIGASAPAPTGTQISPLVSANKSIIDAAMRATKQ